MKLNAKIKTTLCLLCIVVLTVAFLLICTASNNSKTLDAYFKDYVKADSYKNIYIYDCNNEAIYTGGFSDDEVLRLSTFHIIGDKYGSVTDSLLTKTAPKIQMFNRFTGYKPQTKRIKLTIDANLQKGAYTLLTNNGYRGCIIVSDYTTGEIKTLVSTPSVDVYNTDFIEDGAFLNKATMAYPPGSVFKSVSVAAMLENNPSAKLFTYNCIGKTHHISCSGLKKHGKQTLSLALSNSCNCGISIAGKTYITADQLNDFTEKSGILSDQIITDLNTSKGSIDAYDDLMWSLNGQSKNLTTPLGVVTYYNTIANKGFQKKLFLCEASKSTKATRIISEATANYLTDSLKNVSLNVGIECESFSKTGTAELDNDTAHAWFACCLKDPNAPPYTVVVFLEHGGSSAVSKTVAKEYINNYIIK